jgi:hypothetical protein
LRRDQFQTGMKLGFDIFRPLDDGSPLWVAQAATLAEAARRLDSLREFSPGHYFLRDAETGQFVTTDTDGNPGAVFEHA